MEAGLTAVHIRHLSLMKRTLNILEFMLQDVSQETATTLRDGEEGWTVLEVVCHLRDFDQFFYHRAQLMLDETHPPLPAYDHEALAIERDYNGQDLKAMLADLKQSRGQFREFFKGLTAEQWERTGIHPERGDWSMLDSLMQVGHHDVTHLEQIGKILQQ